MGGVEVGTFKRLMSSIVESTMMYGAEVWGCNRNVETLQQVQLKAARLFFGVGTRHPRVSMLWELGDLSVVWIYSQTQMCHILVQGPHQPNV